MNTESSLTLTGVFTGLQMRSSAKAGLLATTCGVGQKLGYEVSPSMAPDNPGIVCVVVNRPSEHPADIILSARYEQFVDLDEVDLELSYSSIPEETEVEVKTDNPIFSIARQKIIGSQKIGVICTHAKKFAINFEISLWVNRPDALLPASQVTLSMAKIVDPTAQQVKKVPLQHVQINLMYNLKGA